MPTFDFVPGSVVRDVLAASRERVLHAVREAYLLHHRGESVNPPSHFLHFPPDDSSRIIGLPAYLGGESPIAGMKWIASFPRNVAHNMQRASAVLVLNDVTTGYPFAVLEASQISAARTAASAVLAAAALTADLPAGLGGRMSFVGCGIISRAIADHLVIRGRPDEVLIHDPHLDSAAALTRHLNVALGLAARTCADPREAWSADVVVLATNAVTPHVTDPSVLRKGQVVLGVSLRDMAPELVLGCQNIVDDVDHCLTASTSVHLAEQISGGRDFVDATLAQLLLGQVQLGTDRPRLFSPFGLGVLDLAVGLMVFRAAQRAGTTVTVPDFFADPTRWVPAGA